MHTHWSTRVQKSNWPCMKRKMIMILSRILSSSSSVASLFPALNLESTYLAVWEAKSQLLRWEVANYQPFAFCLEWKKALIASPNHHHFRQYQPMSSAGLLGLLLMKVSKASFMALMNPSFRVKQLCATLSILSLKSSRSCTMSLSFSGVHTISPPNV